MAYWLNNTLPYNGSRQIQFYMDEDADKDNLPTTTTSGEPQGDSITHLPVDKGSISLSIDSGKIFVLNSSDQWKQLGG